LIDLSIVLYDELAVGKQDEEGIGLRSRLFIKPSYKTLSLFIEDGLAVGLTGVVTIDGLAVGFPPLQVT